jgi:23S rRNA G2445 N2-methylase RlmL
MDEFAVLVNKGLEKVAVAQLREIIGVKDVTVEETIVLFRPKVLDDVYKFIYRSQIANRIILMLGKGKEITDIKQYLDNDFLNKVLKNGVDNFRVSVRVSEHTDVTEMEADIGGFVIDYAQSKGYLLKVNLKNPLLNFYTYMHDDEIYFGIDLSDDLSKRDYKLFNNAVSLKGPTAFGLLMLAGYTPKDIYLDTHCYSGTLEIEAALYANNISHRFYNKSFPFMKLSKDDVDWGRFFEKLDNERTQEKFPITGSDTLLSSITAAVKNAKIAGVGSFIDFRRIDLDWLDLKLEEHSVDKIISFIPGSSKHDRHLEKNFKQLFYQAEYILKDSGTLTIMCLSKDLLIKNALEYFDVDHESMIYSGVQPMHILFFKKK